MEAPSLVLDKPWIPQTALPRRVRDWGYYPDVKAWQAGDVVLTRSSEPDLVSRKIADFQSVNYGKEAGSWTHAAVYLGDNLMLCEAQFDPPSACSVIIAKVMDYVGSHELKVRRSLHAEDPVSGWAIATATATKIGAAYDVAFIAKLAIDRALLGADVFVRDQSAKSSSSRAYVCSSLYATAHAWVTDVALGDKLNGLCTPAWLAAIGEPHLRDVEFGWHDIA